MFTSTFDEAALRAWLNTNRITGPEQDDIVATLRPLPPNASRFRIQQALSGIPTMPSALAASLAHDIYDQANPAAPVPPPAPAGQTPRPAPASTLPSDTGGGTVVVTPSSSRPPVRRGLLYLLGAAIVIGVVALVWHFWPTSGVVETEEVATGAYDPTARKIAKDADTRSRVNRKGLERLSAQVNGMRNAAPAAIAAGEWCPEGSFDACVKTTVNDELDHGGRKLIASGVLTLEWIEESAEESCERLCPDNSPPGPVARNEDRPAPRNRQLPRRQPTPPPADPPQPTGPVGPGDL